MVLDLNRKYEGVGTRFAVLPQARFLDGLEKPEIITVSTPPTALTRGPCDADITVTDVPGKPYTDLVDFVPPSGRALDPPKANRQGHFDSIDVADPGFRAANVYASIRRVLDVWESYLGRRVYWHFLEGARQPLQVIPFVDWDNAQFGWGFMELGWGGNREAKTQDIPPRDEQFAYNFDVIAHETGHGLIFSLAGIPFEDAWTAEYRGFHESASDLVALIAALHFDSVVSNLLEKTKGNLYAENEVSRIGELSGNKQIRVASNALTMDQVPYSDLDADALTNKQVHLLGEPLTGAFFDMLVAIYQQRLLELGAISQKLAVLDDDPELIAARMPELQAGYGKAYAKAPETFRRALQEARDIMGRRLALTWDILGPDWLDYDQVARTFLTVDRHLSAWKHQSACVECFRWRGIGRR